jgi:hypothetical protein
MVNEAVMGVEVEPMLEVEIRKVQLEDEKIREIRHLIRGTRSSISLRMATKPRG